MNLIQGHTRRFEMRKDEIVSVSDYLKKYSKDPSLRSELERIDVSAIIASKIIKHRIENKLSQSELAKKLGVSQKLVSKWESGRNNFTISTLEKLSEFFGWDLEYTFEKIDKRVPTTR